MTSPITTDRLVAAGLIILSLVPVAAGLTRLCCLAGDAPITADTIRFLSNPLPVIVHVLSTAVFCMLGAFQFSRGIRRRWPEWHRFAGRVLVPAGIIAALSGLWLTQFFPPAQGDGRALYALRFIAGSAWILFLLLGVASIARRDIARHRAWMIRASAIGFGAGTQLLVHIPWIALVGQPYGSSRALLLGAGWTINLLVAEWIIAMKPTSSSVKTQFITGES